MNKQKLTVILSVTAAVLMVVLIVLIAARSCGKQDTLVEEPSGSVTVSDATVSESEESSSDTEATTTEEPGEVIIGIDDDITESNADQTNASSGGSNGGSGSGNGSNGGSNSGSNEGSESSEGDGVIELPFVPADEL